MRPTEGSVLHDMLQQGRAMDGLDVHEVLVAATLKTTVEEVRKLDKVCYMEHLDDWSDGPENVEADAPPLQAITQMGRTASSDTDQSPVQAMTANADVARELGGACSAKATGRRSEATGTGSGKAPSSATGSKPGGGWRIVVHHGARQRSTPRVAPRFDAPVAGESEANRGSLYPGRDFGRAHATTRNHE
jgi:hypothetical protein